MGNKISHERLFMSPEPYRASRCPFMVVRHPPRHDNRDHHRAQRADRRAAPSSDAGDLGAGGMGHLVGPGSTRGRSSGITPTRTVKTDGGSHQRAT